MRFQHLSPIQKCGTDLALQRMSFAVVVQTPNTRRPEAAPFTAPQAVTSCVLVSVPRPTSRAEVKTSDHTRGRSGVVPQA